MYFITGNHEEFGDDTAFIAAVKFAGVRVLHDEVVEIDDLQIIGVDYHTTSNTKNFHDILSGLQINRKKPSILLKHEPKDPEVAQQAGVSFMISGHTHRGQQWPLGYIARSVYKGFEYGMKDSASMRVYTSSGVGTWGPPVRVGTQSEIVVFTF